MKFAVEGSDATTGKSLTVVVEADNSGDATAIAQMQGLTVGRSYPIAPPSSRGSRSKRLKPGVDVFLAKLFLGLMFFCCLVSFVFSLGSRDTLPEYSEHLMSFAVIFAVGMTASVFGFAVLSILERILSSCELRRLEAS